MKPVFQMFLFIVGAFTLLGALSVQACNTQTQNMELKEENALMVQQYEAEVNAHMLCVDEFQAFRFETEDLREAFRVQSEQVAQLEKTLESERLDNHEQVVKLMEELEKEQSINQAVEEKRIHLPESFVAKVESAIGIREILQTIVPGKQSQQQSFLLLTVGIVFVGLVTGFSLDIRANSKDRDEGDSQEYIEFSSQRHESHQEDDVLVRMSREQCHSYVRWQRNRR